MIFPAAGLWPYKAITAILRKVTKLGVRLHIYYDQVPVPADYEAGESRHMESDKQVSGQDQGQKIVLHATNGHASCLLVELTEMQAKQQG